MFGRKTQDEARVTDDRADHGRFSRDSAATRDAETTARPTEPATREHGASEAMDPSAHRGIGADHMRALRERQRAEFGGFSWSAAFFGWLVAFGLAAILSGLLAATGAGTGLTESADRETVGLAGGIALLVAAALAYYFGGYVAGRLSRFDGGRQGLGVWLFSLLATILLGALAAVLGSEYNVVGRAELPRLAVGEETATTAGIIAMAAMLAVTLLSAMAGGKAGERWHKKVDRHVID